MLYHVIDITMLVEKMRLEMTWLFVEDNILAVAAGRAPNFCRLLPLLPCCLNFEGLDVLFVDSINIHTSLLG